jgi:nucleoside-diphosphate-sugar epimerase
VYASPTPLDLSEAAPTVTGSPGAEATEYPQDKRGGELAVEAGFGDRSVLARAGLILGPHENVGRLPYWLLRLARGGEVLAPGPPQVPVRFIDARDLAAWLLEAAQGEFCGPVNLVNPPGHATMGRLLEAALAAVGGDARLVWVDPGAVEAAGIHRWTELPIWLPPADEFAGLLDTRVDRALATGLRCRSVEATVQDTWTWLLDCGLTPPPAPPDRPPLGLDPEKEARALDAWRGKGSTS